MNIGEQEKVIFDSLYDGVLIADRDYTVLYVNPSYVRITKVKPEDIVGKSIAEVREGSKLPQVIKSGRKLLGVYRRVGETEYMVNMAPIVENGEIVGGISILNEINDVYRLTEQLKKSTSIIDDLKRRVKQMGKAHYTIDDIVGEDLRTRETKELTCKIAEKDMNVLITGESGTGKELYAQSIHNASTRSSGPFVAVNCAALDDNLLESELFGYEEGAFTGAKKGGKSGLFQEAHGGTIFLDEISELDYRLQAKLLRILQENMIRPVGSTSEIAVDVRVIAATNKGLEALVKENSFRHDLYYRLAVFTLNLYPLRERRGDIIPLINHFLSHAHTKFGRKIELNDETLMLLCSYDWPGNVRELKNTIEYAVMMAEGEVIKNEDLPRRIMEAGIKNNVIDIRPLEEAIKEVEQKEIRNALLKYGDTVEGKKRVAEALGISLATLYNKIK